MRSDHRLGNRKAETESAKAPRDRGLSLLECVEDFSDLFLLNANSGVADANLNVFGQSVGSRDRDSTVGRRKLDAVFDEIPKHLLQSRRVAFDVDVLRVELKFCLD